MVDRPNSEAGRLLYFGSNELEPSTGCGCECSDCLEVGKGGITDCTHHARMPSVYYTADSNSIPNLNNPARLDYVGNCTYHSETFEYESQSGTKYTLRWSMVILGPNDWTLSIIDAVVT